ncbi:PEGA domain-containing protein [Calidithermus timidus]|jgi:hypothetical protein|uniref:PEGA domain-containing protein n=1 Tax=Calidithermus timidus TaxID=307124 RepID=UPI00037F1F32|nr:PEGA domain-containing protein [Calidithermus timidus]
MRLRLIPFAFLAFLLAGCFPVVVEVPPSPEVTTLEVRTSSAQAIVFVDGREVGRVGPDRMLVLPRIQPGTHEVVVLAPGHEVFIQTIHIAPGQRLLINATLRRLSP